MRLRGRRRQARLHALVARQRQAGVVADDGRAADWVRIRREYLSDSPLRAVQFSFSVDPKDNRETVVFYWRDTKNVLQLALEDQVAAGTAPAAVLASGTPVNHIRVARYGTPSLVLARCANYDQRQYEPIFRLSSEIMNKFRAAMAVKTLVPAEMARIRGAGELRRREEGSGRSAGKRRH